MQLKEGVSSRFIYRLYLLLMGISVSFSIYSGEIFQNYCILLILTG